MKKGKAAAEIRKRVVVGLFMFFCASFPLFFNPIVQVLNNIFICRLICLEVFELKIKEFETMLEYKVMKHTLIFLSFFAFVTNYWLALIG